MQLNRYGIIVIGDEILSGRRQDKHLAKAIELLNARGESIAWAQYIGDDEKQITDVLRSAMQSGDIVFCFGGIGGTPDDLTRQCAANAAGIRLTRHPQAVELIEGRFGEEAYPNRIIMADLPEGCDLVPNPYNQIPGFQIGSLYFLPGFPVMAHPMMNWILDTHYPLSQPADYVESNLFIHDTHESSIIKPMQELINRHPLVRFFSLPIHTDGSIRLIEFGAKGSAVNVEKAMHDLKSSLDELGFKWTLERSLST